MSSSGSTLKADLSPDDIQSLFKKKSVGIGLKALSDLIHRAKLDLQDFSDGFEYSGFDREQIGRLCAKRFGAEGTAKLILIGVKRGTRLDKILEKSTKPDPQIAKWYEDGLVTKGGTGREVVSIGRILACFPNCAALISQLFNVAGKFPNLDCPEELQFPAAASLPMSPVVRSQHIQFCVVFGDLIASPMKPSFYKIAFDSMLPVSELDQRVLKACGNPTDKVARSFDIKTALAALEDDSRKAGKAKRGGGVSIDDPKLKSFRLSSQSGSDDISHLFEG